MISEAADAANAALYLGEGNVKMAGLSGLALIPLVGNVATVGKVAGKAEKAAELGADAGTTAAKESQTLFHYTTEEGMKGIVDSKSLYPSLKSVNPKDARYGNGQYMSNIVPGMRTPSELSYDFLRVPYQGRRFTHYVEIDVTGLDVLMGREGVFVIPNESILDLTNRIVGSGKVPR